MASETAAKTLEEMDAFCGDSRAQEEVAIMREAAQNARRRCSVHSTRAGAAARKVKV